VGLVEVVGAAVEEEEAEEVVGAEAAKVEEEASEINCI
jgi:hypothetical protein